MSFDRNSFHERTGQMVGIFYKENQSKPEADELCMGLGCIVGVQSLACTVSLIWYNHQKKEVPGKQ